MELIPVEIIRPEVATKVLCLCSKGSYWIGFRANGGWYFNTNYGMLYVPNDGTEKRIEIVYWSHLPEIPKELMTKLFPEKCNSDTCPDDGQCEHCQKPI
jgi:hypothetical protein